MASRSLRFQFRQECDVSTEKTSFTWTVKKFSCAIKLKKLITSDKFFNDVTKTKWNLELTTVEHGSDSILRLTLRGSKTRNHYEELSFSLKDSSNKLIKSKRIATSDVSYPVSVEFPQVKDLSSLIPDDILQIHVEVTEFVDSHSTMIEKPEGARLSFLKDFSTKLGDIWNTGRFFDLTVFVNGMEIEAHKLVLASSSPVFAAMLDHPTPEDSTNYIHIADFDGDVIKEMIRYMYTRQLPNFQNLGVDFSRQLFKAADKYAVKGLNSCQTFNQA